MSEDDPQTVGDFLADTLTEEEFVDAIVGAVVGGLLLRAIAGDFKPFRLYDWCFRHIDYWNNRAQRKYIESMRSHVNQRHRIMIPGSKLIRRPRKPK